MILIERSLFLDPTPDIAFAKPSKDTCSSSHDNKRFCNLRAGMSHCRTEHRSRYVHAEFSSYQLQIFGFALEDRMEILSTNPYENQSGYFSCAPNVLPFTSCALVSLCHPSC